MASKTKLQEIINFYYANKLSYFPLPYGEKSDKSFKWGEFQKRKPSLPESKTWFGNGTQHNVAVVCGQVSGGLVILDCDSEDRFYELSEIICQKLDIDTVLDYTRVSQTGKGYHIWLFVKEPVQSAKFPKLDIKAEGGYIVAPPSLHPDGPEYKFINPLIPIKHIDNLLSIGIDLTQRDKSVTDSVTRTGERNNWITQVLKGIGEGDRNAICYKLASHFKNSQPIDITEALLLDWNTRNKPPLDEAELLRTIRSAYNRNPNVVVNSQACSGGGEGKGVGGGEGGGEGGYSPDYVDFNSVRNKNVTESVTTRPLAERVEEWVKDSSGWFTYEEIDREFGISGESAKSNRRMIVKRLRESGAIEQHPKDNKRYRYIDVSVRLIDFKSALNNQSLTIKYPFGIEKYFKTYPGNIIVVAGAPDAGKTAFLLNLIHLNQFDYTIYYQSSEMGQEELANRLGNFDDMSLDDWNFIAEERSSNFADIIRPDCVNIIDYMELSGEFYMVAEYLKQIYEKLAGGIAIVALQKDPKADQGRGGTFGLEKPRLYLNLDAGKITIRKAKNWTKPNVNPNRLEKQFKIVGGCKFIETSEWHKPDDF